MSILRGPIPADAFTIIENAWLRDRHLSWKAKGLLAYIASHAAGHRLTRDQMLAEGADGKDALISGLMELEERGYLARRRVRGEDGKITGTDYVLTTPVDSPVDSPVDASVDDNVDSARAGSSTAGKPDCGRDQGEHGVSAGQNQGGFSGGGKPAGKKTTEEKTREKTNSSPSARRGTRLPDPFEVTEEMRAWYREKIGGAIDGQTEHEKFLDYWRAQPGAKGVKHDWAATWRNWMRTAMQRSGRRPTSGAPAGADRPRFPTAQERSQQQRDAWAALAKEAEAWVEANGGDAEDGQLVLQVMERMKIERANGSATRTPGMYSDGKDVINGEVVGPREVTAGEGS